MLVNTLFIAGLASLAVAVPPIRFEHGLEQRSAPIHARGAPSAPRSLHRRKVEEITITQLQDQILSGSQISSEVELVQLVQEKIIIIDQTQQNKDNIRRNHFANVYNTVNTVVVIVTPVVDQRNSNGKNTRYMSRKINSNVQSSEQVTVVIQESTPITIGGGGNGNGNGRGQGNGQAGAASPTGAAGAQPTLSAQVNSTVATVDPNSMSTISGSNDTMLLPAGIPVPNFGGMQVIQDPAIIIEKNQKAFVGFGNQQQQQASIIDISSGAAGVTIITA